MTSTIKVNNIQNQCGQNIINENSNTITIGASGDTIALASGASQSGFGRTGTVDWQTGDIKTSTFTAESGKGYFCNTAGGEFEVDLPAGTPGAIVSIQDYNNTFDTRALSIDPNGSEKINGGSAGGLITLNTEGEGITLVYIDSTVGWRSIQDNTFADKGLTPAYITATGGTITTVCTNFKVHTFTGPGTFCVSAGAGNLAQAEYLVIAGGGGGGGQYIGGGGGAGGYRESSGTAGGCYSVSPLGACVSALTLTPGAIPITVGGGGAGGNQAGATDAVVGSNSIFSSITSAGGGFGKQDQTNPANPGAGGSGGSGGGGNGGDGGSNTGQNNVAGTGNTPPVSPPQGNPGGTGGGSGPTARYGGGGGGGATQGGANANISGSGTGGNGGAGATSSINGTPTARAGGGGGNNYNGGTQGSGGSGGGGAANQNSNGVAGTANTGGGGGGTDSRPGPNSGGAGGSGIVIIRYRFQA